MNWLRQASTSQPSILDACRRAIEGNINGIDPNTAITAACRAIDRLCVVQSRNSGDPEHFRGAAKTITAVKTPRGMMLELARMFQKNVGKTFDTEEQAFATLKQVVQAIDENISFSTSARATPLRAVASEDQRTAVSV